MTAYATKLTRSPQAMGKKDVAALRAAGLDDEEIHETCQVVAYFNYANRITNGLGVA